MKRTLLALLVFATSFSAQAEWDGSGFYGTKSTKELEKQMKLKFRVPTSSTNERVTVYNQVPSSVYRSINMCRTNNFSLDMARANTAALTPSSAAVVYETRASYWDDFAPRAYIIVPENGPLFAVDPTVNPCKVWELKTSSNRQQLTAFEAASVKETASLQVGLLFPFNVKLSVTPLSTSLAELGAEYLIKLAQGDLEYLKSQHAIDFLSSKPSLDGTVIELSNAGLCGSLKLNEKDAAKQLVVGFRTGSCSNFKDFAMRGDGTGETCVQVVSAPTYEAARDYYMKNPASRNPSQIPGLISNSVVPTSKLYEALSASGCVL